MKPFTNHILPIVSSIILFASVPALYAWTGPVGTPPANNVSAPINISDKSQNKLGALGLGGLAVFGKTLLTEVSGYTLPTATKPTMLLGVNGAVGAKEYCDENGTNCVSTLGGSGGSGVGLNGVSSTSTVLGMWQNVSLTDTSYFDTSCEYRFSTKENGKGAWARMFKTATMYAIAVYPTMLYWAPSNDSGIYVTNANKTSLTITPYGFAAEIKSIQKRC